MACVGLLDSSSAVQVCLHLVDTSALQEHGLCWFARQEYDAHSLVCTGLCVHELVHGQAQQVSRNVV